MIKWFKEYSNLSSNQYSVFLNIINSVQDDLSVFYKMNDILDNGSGEFTYDEDNLVISYKDKNNEEIKSLVFGLGKYDGMQFKIAFFCVFLYDCYRNKKNYITINKF